MDKKILLMGLIFIISILGMTFILMDIDYQDININILGDKNNNVKSITSNQLTWNDIALEDSTVFNEDGTCTGTKLGMKVIINPCTVQSAIPVDLTQYISFNWTGANAHNISAIFVYEGQLSNAKMYTQQMSQVGFQEFKPYNITVTNYLVNNVLSYENLGTPTKCDEGSIYNTQSYNVTFNREGVFRNRVYCFSSVTPVNATAFRISGNATLINQSFTYEDRLDYTNDVSNLISDITQTIPTELRKDFTFYQVSNVEFNTGEQIDTKWVYTPTGKIGKWHILLYDATAESLVDAVQNNRYLYIDPYWTGIAPSGYWKFNETTGNASGLTNGNNLTNTGGSTSFVASGRVNTGNAVQMTGGTGNNMRGQSNDSFMLGGENFTIAFWYNNTVTDCENVIMGQSSTASNGYDFLDANVGKWYIRANGADFMIAIGTIANNGWNRLVWTRRGTTNLAFINNVNVLNATGSHNFSKNDSFFLVKNSCPGTKRFDDLIIYNNYSWTNAEIAADYNASAGREMDYASAGETLYANITNNFTEPANGTTYSSGATYRFNVTITSTNQSTGLSFNGINYSLTNNSDNYTKIFTDLAGGTYPYYFWAYSNESGNAYSQLTLNYYTISKATSEIATYINNTRADYSISNGTILLNSTLLTGLGTIRLYNNYTLINGGTSPLSNSTTYTTSGEYTILSNYSGNENYTSDSESFILTVNNGGISRYSSCYQETTNASNVNDGGCGLNYSGSYTTSGVADTSFPFSNSYDGDYNTYTTPSSGTIFVYSIYKIPINSIDSPIWQVKTGAGMANFTIPYSCRISNNITTRLRAENGLLPNDQNISCLNQSSGEYLDLGDSIDSALLYEEGMYWNISAYLINNVTYSNPIVEQVSTDIVLNLNYSTAVYPSVTATLYYNNTAYPSTKTGSGTNTQYSNTITTPAVSTDTNISFFWTLQFYNGSNYYNFDTDIYNQTVKNLVIDNCTSGTYKLFNFTIYDEDTLVRLSPPFYNQTYQAELYIDDVLTFYGNASNVSEFLICSNSAIVGNLSTDFQIRYDADGSGTTYVTEYYNVQNYDLNSYTVGRNISLYDLIGTNSEECLFTIKDSNFLPLSNALVEITRKYLSDGTFKTVEVPKTDSLGKTIGHFVLNDEIYSIYVRKDGSLLSSYTNVLAVKPTGSDCIFNLNPNSASSTPADFTVYGDLLISDATYDDTTRTYEISWATDSGASSNITLYGYVDGERICVNELLASSGTSLCTLSSSYTNKTVRFALYNTGDEVFDDYVNIGYKRVNLNTIRFIVTAGLIPLFVLMAGSSVTIASVFFIIGILLAGGLALFDTQSLIGTGSFVMWLIIGAAILIFKFVQNRNNG